MLLHDLYQILGGEMSVLFHELLESVFCCACKWIPCSCCREISMACYWSILSRQLLCACVIFRIAFPPILGLALLAAIALQGNLVANLAWKEIAPDLQRLVLHQKACPILFVFQEGLPIFKRIL